MKNEKKKHMPRKKRSGSRPGDPKKALFMTRIWNPLDQRSVTRINKRVPTSCKELSSWSDGHYFLINISFTFSFLIPPAGGSCLSSSMSLSRRKERKRKEKEMMPAVHLMKGWPGRRPAGRSFHDETAGHSLFFLLFIMSWRAWSSYSLSFWPARTMKREEEG